MSKKLRTRMTTELTTRVKGVSAGVLVDFKGVSAGLADNLRKELRTGNVRMQVLKNSLAKLAFKDAGLEKLAATLTGPVALVYGPDPVTVAKKLIGWKEKHKKLEIRAGVLGKEILTAAQVKALSTLPSREALLAQTANLMASPMIGFATVTKQVIQKMAQLLKALEEKKAKEGPAPASA